MIYAATGHRPDKLGGYGDEVFAALERVALKFIFKHKPECIISGMALGWDQAIASACIATDTKFIAAVPFVGQERRWPVKSQEYYRKLLQKAYLVQVVSQGGFTHNVMHIRNHWMVENTEAMVSLFNPAETSGGTYSCLAYARKRKRPIIPMWDVWLDEQRGIGKGTKSGIRRTVEH